MSLTTCLNKNVEQPNIDQMTVKDFTGYSVSKGQNRHITQIIQHYIITTLSEPQTQTPCRNCSPPQHHKLSSSLISFQHI